MQHKSIFHYRRPCPDGLDGCPYIVGDGDAIAAANSHLEFLHTGSRSKDIINQPVTVLAADQTASIAAAIAQRIEAGISPQHVVRVRPTHDVLALWGDAGLPELSKRDSLLLLLVRRTLLWSGRYAAPRDDENHERDLAQERAIREPRLESNIFTVAKPSALEWDDFERLYEVAYSEFIRAREIFEGRFGSM